MTDYPIVHVLWEDSTAWPQGWQSLEEYRDDPVILCQSVGWLVREDAEAIVVVPHWYEDNDNTQVTGTVTIPRDAILTMDTLKEAPDAD